MDAQAPSTEFVWRELHTELRQFIRRRLPDEHVAEDLLQEVFVRIHSHLDALGDADRLPAWVYRIGRNVIHDHFRAKASIAAPLSDDAASAAEDDEQQRGFAWLRAMVEQLPETYREAVRLSELDGLLQQDVADRLDVSVSGAKSRVQRGRALLKSMLLDCCDFEFDRRGNVVDYQQRGRCPADATGCDCS